MYVFQVLSHKVMRWLSPHLLLLLLAVSVLLAGSSAWGVLLLSGQLLIYLLAAVGYVAQKRGIRWSVLAAPLFFAAINLAFVVGFWNWIAGEKRGAWDPAR
jgi:hypothetical protein